MSDKKKKTLNEMNMGELWAIAKSKNISIKGKKKAELIKEITKPVVKKSVEKKPVEKTKPKKVKEAMVEATLEDGTKVLVPAKEVTQATKADDDGMVVIKSVDGRELEASIGTVYWVGKEIRVPKEQVEEVKRLLKDGGFYFV